MATFKGEGPGLQHRTTLGMCVFHHTLGWQYYSEESEQERLKSLVKADKVISDRVKIQT